MGFFYGNIYLYDFIFVFFCIFLFLCIFYELFFSIFFPSYPIKFKKHLTTFSQPTAPQLEVVRPYPSLHPYSPHPPYNFIGHYYVPNSVPLPFVPLSMNFVLLLSADWYDRLPVYVKLPWRKVVKPPKEKEIIVFFFFLNFMLLYKFRNQ
jgi:hypothetical protein